MLNFKNRILNWKKKQEFDDDNFLMKYELDSDDSQELIDSRGEEQRVDKWKKLKYVNKIIKLGKIPPHMARSQTCEDKLLKDLS